MYAGWGLHLRLRRQLHCCHRGQFWRGATTVRSTTLQTLLLHSRSHLSVSTRLLEMHAMREAHRNPCIPLCMLMSSLQVQHEHGHSERIPRRIRVRPKCSHFPSQVLPPLQVRSGSLLLCMHCTCRPAYCTTYLAAANEWMGGSAKSWPVATAAHAPPLVHAHIQPLHLCVFLRAGPCDARSSSSC